MNNRYLFRAKRIDNGEWVEGFLVKKHGLFFIYDIINSDTCRQPNYEVDQYTICQCTGIPDKNVKKIYEKNIVRDEDGYIGIVEFGVLYNYSIGFYIRWLSGNAKSYRNELGYWAHKVEVVGSEFDNPELLEVGE